MSVNKILFFAAGLIITIAIIAMGINVFNQAKRDAGKIMEQESSELDSITEGCITRYDGMEITGITAINQIKKIDMDCEIVVTVKKTDGSKFRFTVDTSQYALYKDVTSEYYIAPLDMYFYEVERDKNSLIVKVLITHTDFK